MANRPYMLVVKDPLQSYLFFVSVPSIFDLKVALKKFKTLIELRGVHTLTILTAHPFQIDSWKTILSSSC